MKLAQQGITATIAEADIGKDRPFPDDPSLDTAADQVLDAIETGLAAVVENLKSRFPNVTFTIE